MTSAVLTLPTSNVRPLPTFRGETATIADVEAVALGAALLDDTLPGWFRFIDLDVLDVGDLEMCVLGQLFDDDDVDVPRWFILGYPTPEAYTASSPSWRTVDETVCVANYNVGRYVLGLDKDAIDEHGFGVTHDSSRGTSFKGLDSAWAGAVRDRQRIEVRA